MTCVHDLTRNIKYVFFFLQKGHVGWAYVDERNFKETNIFEIAETASRLRNGKK